MARVQQVPKEYKDARDKLAEAGKFQGERLGGGRIRKGKTRRDREGGAHARAEGRKRFPIRCTSNHRLGGQDNRGPEFWMG